MKFGIPSLLDHYIEDKAEQVVLCGDTAQCVERICLLQDEAGLDHFVFTSIWAA
jgi:hypothetical protein